MIRCALLLAGLVGVVAHAAEDRVFLWSYRTDGVVRHAPVADGRSIFVGTTGGSVHALDERGTRAWKTGFSKRGGVPAAIQRIALSDGTLFVELADGGAHALDARTGKPLEAAGRVPAEPPRSDAQVKVEGSVVRVVEAGSGEVVWSKTMPRAVTAAAVLGGNVVICLDDATVQAWGPPPEVRDRTVDEL